MEQQQQCAPVRRRSREGEMRYLILDYIIEFTRANRFPPTVREITDGVGLGSTATTYRHLQNLVKERLLIRKDNRARAMVPAGEEWQQQEEG